MVGVVKLMRTKWYPSPHHFSIDYAHGLETGVVNNTTILPLAFTDEAQGAPLALETHPENAAFAVQAKANCFPDSRIDFIVASLRFSMTKAALETDKLHVIRCGFMPIFTTFDDLDAVDELSTLTIGQVLEMQDEDTDNQAFPLYNDIKLTELVAGSATLHADQPGLTTTQVLEGVAFAVDTYYDNLQFLTTSNKLKVCQGGLKWFELQRNHPTKTVKIRIRPKVKRMVKKAFMGVLVVVPPVGGNHSYNFAADTTNVLHVSVQTQVRYNEWNQDFDFRKVSA